MPERFDPSRDHRVHREKAAGSVKAFQSGAKAGDHRATVFNRRAFEHLLAQPGAAGIRIYRAQREDGSPTMALVAVDQEGKDLVQGQAAFCLDGHDCPPWCIPPTWL